MFYHFYADDTQLYITFRTSSVSDMNLSNAKLINCVRDMEAWMLSNKLNLNKDKSEVLVISTSHILALRRILEGVHRKIYLLFWHSLTSSTAP